MRTLGFRLDITYKLFRYVNVIKPCLTIKYRQIVFKGLDTVQNVFRIVMGK